MLPFNPEIQTEGLRPVDRKEQRHGLTQELRLGRLVDLADELHQRIVQERLDVALEVDA